MRHHSQSVRGLRLVSSLINRWYEIRDVCARVHSDVYFAREPEILVSARDGLLGRSESRKWYKVDVLEKIMVRAMRECKWSRWKACRALSSVLRIPCVCLPSLEKKIQRVLGRCVHGGRPLPRRISLFRDASFVFTSYNNNNHEQRAKRRKERERGWIDGCCGTECKMNRIHG